MSSETPKRIYCRSNICVLCGFSFVQRSVSSTGEEKIEKFFTQKLRLNHERIQKIKVVIADFEMEPSCDDSNGVCVKCWRRIENVIKMQKGIEEHTAYLTKSRNTVNTLLLTLPSPRKQTVTKRLLKSPESGKEVKFLKSFPTTVVRKYPVQLPPLLPLQSLKRQEAGLSCSPSKLLPGIPLLPGVEKLPSTDENEGSSDKRTARRSIQFQAYEKSPDIERPDGEVEVTIFYPSGTKRKIVEEEGQKKACRAIVRGSNFERVVLDHISIVKPMDVVRNSSKVVAEECRILCKKNSHSLLQKKTHDDIMNFKWELFYNEIKTRCPGLCSILSAIVSDLPIQATGKAFHHMLMTAAIGLHGRSQNMSALQYISGFLLTHGGCTQKNIQRLSQIGFTTHPVTLHQKLLSWESELSAEIKDLRNEWAAGGQKKYQLIGDNWDKNILPSYRTSDRKTLSLHLFNMYAITDRICPQPSTSYTRITDVADLDCLTFIPSKEEQALLLKEMTFLFSTSIIANHPELNRKFKQIYPQHLPHKYSHQAGLKTSQYPLGLFDCNENKTQDVIKLLADLTEEYVPFSDGEIVESVFLGGDRLTDERVQCAQQSVGNGLTPKDRLEGFISKIEDFHRLMNFLEAIHKMTYSTQSGKEKGTMYFFRNLLNMRNVKGNVRNAYRPFKLLYYIVMDAVCLLLFLNHLNLQDHQTAIRFPDDFTERSAEERIQWLDDVSEKIVKEWFFDDSEDLFDALRSVLSDPQHQENYWVSNLEEGRVKCHFCVKTYAYIGSLKAHEAKCHNVTIHKKKSKGKDKKSDHLKDHVLMLFKLTMLHRNLDQAVDMADGCRSVRSAKYELPLYNKTNKVKYVIGSVHLTALTSGTLPTEQTERLIANRFVNVQGGKNHNIALDEYLEMLNRDSKIACSGHKTKESIIKHSKEYPHLTQSARNFENMCNLRQRKGFHHLPSYGADVHKVLHELTQLDVLTTKPGRSLQCKGLCTDRNPFSNSESNLSTMIHRHKPTVPFARLRNKHI